MEVSELDILSKSDWGHVRLINGTEILHLRFKQISFNLNDIELEYFIEELKNKNLHVCFSTYLGDRIFIHAAMLNLDFVFTQEEKEELLKLLIEASLIFKTRRIIKYNTAKK